MSKLTRDFHPAHAAQTGSVAQIALAYLADIARRQYATGTITNRHHHLILFADFLAERGVIAAAQVTRPMIERYQRSLFHARKPNGDAYTVGYQIQCVKSIEMVFKWAIRKNLIPANPATDLDYPKRHQALPDVLAVDEIEKVLAYPDTETPLGLRDRAIFELLYSTGMRRMECCNLTWDDIDAHKGVVRILKGKGRKDRYAPLGSRAAIWLREYRLVAHPRLCRDAAVKTIFLSHRGGPLTKRDLSKICLDALRGSGVRQQGGCHIFRHTFATALLAGGCDVRLVQEMLGHAKLNTTALYTHVTIGHLKQAHDAFHPAEKPF